jgi:hypothetical protein
MLMILQYTFLGKIFQLYKLKSKKTWIELNYGKRIIICL